MRAVLSPRKKTRKKNRKKVDRTKTRFQPIQETPEWAADVITGKDDMIPVPGPEDDSADEQEPEKEVHSIPDYADGYPEESVIVIPPEPPEVEKTGETDGIEDIPLPSSEKSKRPEVDDS